MRRRNWQGTGLWAYTTPPCPRWEVTLVMRSIGLALALAAGSAAAGEHMDCYNDDLDADLRYTRAEPDVLRVSDAEIAAMLARMHASESTSVAAVEGEKTLQVSLGSTASGSD